MYVHELISLLNTFSPKELMWFDKFLNSPYFNNRKRIVSLFRILRKFYPGFDSKGLTKENIYAKIYGNLPYNDSTFRNLMSDLLQLTLQFLKIEGLEKKEVKSSFFITEELFQRGNYKLFRSLMNTNEKILDSDNKIDSDYFLNKYRIIMDNFYINLLTQKVIKKPYVISESQKMINGIVFILSYFILESIKHNDNLLQYSRSYNIQKNVNTVSHFIEIFNFEKLISYIRNNSSLNTPIVEVYYNLLKAFTNFEDEKFYYEFKKSLLHNSGLIGLNDNNFLFTRLMDYSVQKMNMGLHTGYDIRTELFELYKIFVKEEHYKTETNKYLPFDIYRNILLNCVVIKELKYMEEFIKKYSKKLLPNDIHSAENYSYALLNFEKGFYNHALSCISKIKFDQVVYKLDMKNLQLKINYEQEQFESALSNIDTYKHFLKNSPLLSETRKLMHNNFVFYTHKLIQYRTGSQKINLSYIEDKIKKSKNIFDKGWLLEKANYLN